MSRPTGLLLINDFHVLINGAYTMRERGVRFLPSPRPFPIFSLRVEAGNAPRMRVEGIFSSFPSFLERAFFQRAVKELRESERDCYPGEERRRRQVVASRPRGY